MKLYDIKILWVKTKNQKAVEIWSINSLKIFYICEKSFKLNTQLNSPTWTWTFVFKNFKQNFNNIQKHDIFYPQFYDSIVSKYDEYVDMLEKNEEENMSCLTFFEVTPFRFYKNQDDKEKNTHTKERTPFLCVAWGPFITNASANGLRAKKELIVCIFCLTRTILNFHFFS